MLSFAYFVGHFHVPAKFLINKALVSNPKSVDEVVIAEIVDFEEFITLELLFQPECSFNEVGADLVQTREADLHHEGDTGFHRM